MSSGSMLGIGGRDGMAGRAGGGSGPGGGGGTAGGTLAHVSSSQEALASKLGVPKPADRA